MINRYVFDASGERFFSELSEESAVALVEKLEAEHRVAFVIEDPRPLKSACVAAAESVAAAAAAVTAMTEERDVALAEVGGLKDGLDAAVAECESARGMFEAVNAQHQELLQRLGVMTQEEALSAIESLTTAAADNTQPN